MNTRWIWTDIDGRGDRWHLAVIRGDSVIFPVADFEDEAETYDDCPQVAIRPPQNPYRELEATP